MSETLRIVAMGTCRDCEGSGFGGGVKVDDGNAPLCRHCKGEGVCERQITVRELRHMLEADAKAEAAEMDAGRFPEVETDG